MTSKLKIVVVEVVAERHDNEKELHRHACVPGHGYYVESILGIRDGLALAHIDLRA